MKSTPTHIPQVEHPLLHLAAVLRTDQTSWACCAVIRVSDARPSRDFWSRRRADPDFGLIDTRLDSPVEPLPTGSCRFCRSCLESGGNSLAVSSERCELRLIRRRSQGSWARTGCVSVSQPSTFRIRICPEARSAHSNIGTVSAQGSTVCVFMRRRNSSFKRKRPVLVL